MSQSISISLPYANWRPPVSTLSALPTSGNQTSDAIVTQDTSTIYIWNGSSWVPVSGGGGSTSWGSITGTLSNQTDLQSALDAKLFNTDSLYSLSNTSDATKLQKFNLSSQTTGTTLTIAPQLTSNMQLQIPTVATSGGAAQALLQDITTGFIFSNGITSSIGAANSMMQLANASTANRAQIKLHSYFNGTSVSGVSTLTSRSGVIGTNAAVVAGQDYSKWTAQAAATTPGSAPISGTFSFKANTVNSLTVTSDFHLQLTNLAGTLGDRLYLSSEGLLQLPGYTSGMAQFDSTGNLTSVSSIPHKVYVDFISGSDTTGNGTITKPWKTIQHAYNSISPSINEPYTIYLSGGNNDTDSGTITAKPNVSLVSDYLIQVSGSAFTISGGTSNDGCSFTNIIFIGAFSWVRSDNSTIGLNLYNTQFFSGPTFQQNGSGSANVIAFNCVFVNASFQLPRAGSFFTSCTFLGSTTTFGDVDSNSYYEFLGGYNSSTMSISGGVDLAYFTGIVHDAAFGAALSFVTTGNGAPNVQFDSAGLTPTYTGGPVLTYSSYSQYESYTPSDSTKWVNPQPTTVKQALDRIAAVVGLITPIP
jgi:hypothetical protein